MIFIPNQGTRIADLVTYHQGFYSDYELYKYSTWFSSPNTEDVEKVFSAVDNTRLFDEHDTYYLINQKNASWTGRGFEEFKNQIFNQSGRYEEIPEDYTFDRYKNEIGVCIIPIVTGGYLVLSIDPWTRRKDVRDFEIRLISDGMHFEKSGIDPFLEESELDFSRGEKLELESDLLSGAAIEGRKVRVEQFIRDKDGYITEVLCENPFYERDGLVNRLFSHHNSVLGEYKFVLANVELESEQAGTPEIRNVTVTNYDFAVRHSAENVEITVSLQ